MTPSRNDAHLAIQTALDLLAQRMAMRASYGVYVRAKVQLEAMLHALIGESFSTGTARDAVDIGIMAVRELEGDDPDLADALMLAAYNFEHCV